MKKTQENMDSDYLAANSSQTVVEDFSPEDLYTLKALFLELEKVVDAIPLPPGGSGSMFPGSYMFELLGKVDITPMKKNVIVELIDKLIQFLAANSSSPYQRKGAGLQKFLDLIHTVYSRDCFSAQHMELVQRSYKVYVSAEEPKKKTGQDGWNAPKTTTLPSKTGRLVSYWCFHPGFGMQYLVEEGAKCVILTSGTLSPLSSFASELQVPFPVQLENPHIIKKNQVWVGAICNGPDGFSLNSSFKNRSDPRYKRSLGQTILNLSRVIPDGLLVFFPSYTVMRDCQEEWQNSGVWSKLSERKPIFVEPKMKDEFLTAMQEYYERINDPAFSGACFMAVCRGKVSEGLDFADRNGRAVIITGLPYPPFKDPRVVLKQKYLDEARTKNKQGLTGQAWYSLEASRAVNQAVGRVIRHKDDYGAVILCDSRFAASHFRTQLSAWIRPHVIDYNKFGPVMKEVTQFFRQAQKQLPQPKGDGKARAAAPTSLHQDSIPTMPHPVGAQGLQPMESRPAASGGTPKVTTEPQSAGEGDSDYKSYLKCLTSEPTKNTNAKNESFFSLLYREKEVKDPKVTFTATPFEPDYESVQQNKKRKRIKLVPRVEVEHSNDNNANASEDVPKPLNPAKGVSAVFSAYNGQLELCRPTDPKGNTKDSAEDGESGKKKRLKAVGAYIMEVKAAVPKEKYAVFSSAIKAYKSTFNFENLVTVLPTVFSSSPEQKALMTRLQCFLKKEDKERFQIFLNKTTQT